MADEVKLVPVEIVNNSGQTIRLMVEEDGEQLAYLRRQAKREDLESVKVLSLASLRKPASK
ncbi:gp28 [Streptomyces phage phiSASD1]|uniref:Gp28 n=1 Tax=Streptomyces phage phiSASD1 TaxID=747763 RepID=D7NW54_9CAUD|nr:gp28 [Streptomyces phage phiSASD1]ADE43452.1 gp28 [Streptomyces phage phiSASD1]